jgi:ATP-binding cassette, subfamily F, member 3
MLNIQDITFRIAGRVLLDHASAAIPGGHKVGLVKWHWKIHIIQDHFG